MASHAHYIPCRYSTVSYINGPNYVPSTNSDTTLNPRTAPVPAVQTSVIKGGDLRRCQARGAHRVLHHVDIASVSFLVFSYLLALARAKANTGGVYRCLSANGWG
jgi:hypothetical protein